MPKYRKHDNMQLSGGSREQHAQVFSVKAQIKGFGLNLQLRLAEPAVGK